MEKRNYLIDRLGSKMSSVIGNCVACILVNRKEGVPRGNGQVERRNGIGSKMSSVVGNCVACIY